MKYISGLTRPVLSSLLCYLLITTLVCAGVLLYTSDVAASSGIPRTDPAFSDVREDGSKTAAAPQLLSESALLMDADTGQILFEKNMHRRMFPASITKILTALIALEQGSPDQIITMSEEAVFSIERGSSHIALDKDEQITMEQALYAICLASANDAANGVAETIAGSMDAFAQKMNQRAREAGALNSNFVNAHGLPDDNHYSTAYDIACIMRAAVHLPTFFAYFNEPVYEIPPTNKQPEIRYLHNANCLLNGVIPCEGILAGKTGYTNQAQHTLVSVAKRQDRTLIAVVMKSAGRNDKYYDTMQLFDYGFEQFNPITIPADQLQTIASKRISGHSDVEVTYAAGQPLQLLLHNSLTVQDLAIRYRLPDPANDPVAIPDGSALVRLRDRSGEQNMMYRELAEIPLKAVIAGAPDPEAVPAVGGAAGKTGSNSEKAGLLQTVDAAADRMLPGLKIPAEPDTLLPLAGFLLLIGFTVVWRIVKRRRRNRRLLWLRSQLRDYGIGPADARRLNPRRKSGRIDARKTAPIKKIPQGTAGPTFKGR